MTFTSSRFPIECSASRLSAPGTTRWQTQLNERDRHEHQAARDEVGRCPSSAGGRGRVRARRGGTRAGGWSGRSANPRRGSTRDVDLGRRAHNAAAPGGIGLMPSRGYDWCLQTVLPQTQDPALRRRPVRPSALPTTVGYALPWDPFMARSRRVLAARLGNTGATRRPKTSLDHQRRLSAEARSNLGVHWFPSSSVDPSFALSRR